MFSGENIKEKQMVLQGERTMAKYEIFTDSSCDLPKEMIERLDLKVMQLEVIIDDNPPLLNNQVDIKDFYRQLSEGAMAKTAAVTPGYFEEHARASLEQGNDILYLGFTSGLSVTYNNGVLVLKELQEEFPDRKIYWVDTLCASAGQGMVVYHAAKLRENGATIEEVRDAIEGIKDRIHHRVTLNDLFFLKRGGRIDAASAIAGTVLKFKPLVVVSKEGKLENIGKIRGRKASINELFTQMKKNACLDELPYVFISHSDCYEDARSLADMIENEWNHIKVQICDIGPVIGAHTGAGTIALFYLGSNIKGTQE